MQDALNAVRVAKALGCRRFLFTGSQAEYGVKSELTDEETVCEPTSPYGRAKLAVRQQAEVLCRELGLDYGHARISARMDRAITRGRFFPPVSGSSGQGRR